MKTGKIFQNGQSQAVRLPKEFRVKDDELFIKKIGSALVLIPKSGSWDSLVNSLNKFSDDFMTGRNQPGVQTRESF